MKSQIVYIAEWRKEVAELRAERDRIEEELENTEIGKKYLAAFEAMQKLEKELGELEANYKTDCEAEYAKTQDKDQPGGKIKNYSTYSVTDKIKAVAYVVHHKFVDFLVSNDRAITYAIDNDFLGHLDVVESKLASYAKKNELEVDFIAVTIEPKMTLASDLSEFLS